LQENFIDEIKHLMRSKEELKEITREQRYLTRAIKRIEGEDEKCYCKT